MKYYLELSYPVATNDRDKCDAILRVAVGSPPADSGAGFHAEMGGTARDAGWYFRSRKAAEQVRDRLLHDPTLERISGLIIAEIEELDDDDDD